MFYQNILDGKSPYCLGLGVATKFEEHRHADIEISYCVKGAYDVCINKQTYRLRAGEFALIGPMAAHSFLESADPDSERLTMVVGVTFLKNSFSHFANMKHAFLIADSIRHPALLEKTKGLLDETAELCRSSSEMNDLLIRGNLYKICAYLIECAAADAAENDADFKERTRIVNIDKALEIIYFDYASPLTLEDASRATGYGKSNFCKIFKEITGNTFHYLLNRQRVQGACDLLCQTELSIQQIAQQVGFGETKTFCRIFKEATALTPREYRKKHGYTVK